MKNDDNERPSDRDRAETDPSGSESQDPLDRRPTDPSSRKPVSPGPKHSSRRALPDEHVSKTLANKYRIDKLIAKGGMGRVYRATQFPLERPVAIKILNAEYQRSDPQFVKRFFLEASIAAKLSHPHTITVFDYGEGDDGELFIAMELLIGRSLSRVIAKDGPYDGITAIRIGMQICRALREAHNAGIIHRDLKPGNVFIVDEGGDVPYAKVLDFGLVKLFTPEGEDGETDAPNMLGGDPSLTRTGTLLGSPKYMSPEQIHGVGLDPRTDIYSFGIVMYQMLTGAPPFSGSTGVDVIYKHINHPVPPIHTANPNADVSVELEAVIDRCLRKNRDERYASMDELLAYLKETLDGELGSGPRTAPPKPRESSFRETVGVEEPTPTGLVPAEGPSGPRPRPSRAPIMLAAFGFVVALATLAYVLITLPGHPVGPVDPIDPPASALIEPKTPPPVVEPSSPTPVPEQVDAAPALVKKPAKRPRKGKKRPGRTSPAPAGQRKKVRDAGQDVDLTPTYRDNPY